MSWLAKLYETYEQGMQLELPADKKPMPISHTVQNSHINVVIDGQGNFLRAHVLEKTQIILPATEKSAGRSSGEAAHALADKLQYVAGDYKSYGGEKKYYFDSYLTQLRAWCESPYAHPKVVAVLHYVEKASLIKDLVKAQLVWLDDNNTLLTSWPVDKEDTIAPLFKVLPKEAGRLDQGSALVCWSVQIPGDADADTWKIQSIQQSWIDFDAQHIGNAGLCLLSANEQTIALSHPAKLRHSGDKAKLISANDLDGFTFRGRFTDSQQSIKQHGLQAATVGSISSQKAHNALRWLINRQGARNGDQVIVAWAVSGKAIPQPFIESAPIDLDNFDEIPDWNGALPAGSLVDHSMDLGQSYANKFNRYIAGYNAKLQEHESIVIIAIDSATPGRMGITYYREYFSSDYIKKITQWHTQFAWMQRVVSMSATNKKQRVIWPVSAPTPKAILETVYGDIIKSNTALKKHFFERLMPCIFEGRNMPFDLVQLCVQRASNPLAGEYWEWERSLGVACALYRGYCNRESNKEKSRDFVMGLDEKNVTRDYLYGRLLAIADAIEAKALSVNEKNRLTTAERMMLRFSQHPLSTWNNIEHALLPYQNRLKSHLTGYERAYKKYLDDVYVLFSDGKAFVSDEKLSAEYLLGFHCQRHWLREHKPKDGQWVSISEENQSSTKILSSEGAE